MKIKNGIKKGFVLFGIYLVVTICLLLASERIERLDDNYLRNNNGSVSLSFNK